MGNLAIIPARGGSKRIPRKNIKMFNGAPILKYSIDAAIGARIFDMVMVSTDDDEIGNIAKSCGAEVPFLRSEATANDFATTSDVISEVIQEYAQRGNFFDYVCCLYPTAPFITADKIKASYDKLKRLNADSLVPVVAFSYPIQRAFKIEGDRLSMIFPENIHARSQDLARTYHDAGQFYWTRVKSFLEQKKVFMDNTVAFELAESEVQDIDTEEDWKLAEIKYQFMMGIK